MHIICLVQAAEKQETGQPPFPVSNEIVLPATVFFFPLRLAQMIPAFLIRLADFTGTDAAFHFALFPLKLESLLVQGMELRDEGQTALVFLTLEMMDTVGADERDMEDISAFVGQIEGVKNGATLKETRDGHVKISLRTDPGDLNASAVCALLGGGGHAAAAGAMVEGSMEQVRQRVIQAIGQVRNG